MYSVWGLCLRACKQSGSRPSLYAALTSMAPKAAAIAMNKCILVVMHAMAAAHL